MFRAKTIKYIKSKINLKNENVCILPNNKYTPKMELFENGDRQIVLAGNDKLIYVFDTNTKHEIYEKGNNRFEIIVFKKGGIKPIAYINLDEMLFDILGTRNINYDSIKLKNLIMEWLFTFANIYEYDNYLLKRKSFEEISMVFYLRIFKELCRRVEEEFIKC